MIPNAHPQIAEIQSVVHRAVPPGLPASGSRRLRSQPHAAGQSQGWRKQFDRSRLLAGKCCGRCSGARQSSAGQTTRATSIRRLRTVPQPVGRRAARRRYTEGSRRQASLITHRSQTNGRWQPAIHQSHRRRVRSADAMCFNRPGCKNREEQPEEDIGSVVLDLETIVREPRTDPTQQDKTQGSNPSHPASANPHGKDKGRYPENQGNGAQRSFSGSQDGHGCAFEKQPSERRALSQPKDAGKFSDGAIAQVERNRFLIGPQRERGAPLMDINGYSRDELSVLRELSAAPPQWLAWHPLPPEPPLTSEPCCAHRATTSAATPASRKAARSQQHCAGPGMKFGALRARHEVRRRTRPLRPTARPERRARRDLDTSKPNASQ